MLLDSFEVKVTSYAMITKLYLQLAIDYLSTSLNDLSISNISE